MYFDLLPFDGSAYGSASSYSSWFASSSASSYASRSALFILSVRVLTFVQELQASEHRRIHRLG